MSDTINKFPERLFNMTDKWFCEVPSQAEARRFLDDLLNLLFPIREKRHLSKQEIIWRWEKSQADFLNLITPLCQDKEQCPNQKAKAVYSEIPLLYTRLLKNADMYFKCDPASYCREEVILCYPGFYAISVYRIANLIFRQGVPILPRILSEYAHAQTGIDIHPGANIGPDFYIDHGTGVVIGETTIIGRNVKVYQGVTLGATFVDGNLKGEQRHPIIEDNVIIYAGSTILGGDTVIGHDTVVGGNVWLTESVPANSRVYHRPEIVIKGDKK
ncbi:MAG: serine acetyltransferase [Rikenellaceae bacterium]